jgi:hypothetical protein
MLFKNILCIILALKWPICPLSTVPQPLVPSYPLQAEETATAQAKVDSSKPTASIQVSPPGYVGNTGHAVPS